MAEDLPMAKTLSTPAHLFLGTIMRASTISRIGGEIPCVIITPSSISPPPPILVYYPACGWCVGNAEDCEFMMRKISAFTSMIVVGASYRLAPEHPFPHGLDD